MGSEQITVPDFDYEVTENDQMRVHATVQNEADDNQDVTLTARVRLDDHDVTYEKSTDLTVRANDSADASVVLDAEVEAFERGGSLDFDWDARPE